MNNLWLQCVYALCVCVCQLLVQAWHMIEQVNNSNSFVVVVIIIINTQNCNANLEKINEIILTFIFYLLNFTVVCEYFKCFFVTIEIFCVIVFEKKRNFSDLLELFR